MHQQSILQQCLFPKIPCRHLSIVETKIVWRNTAVLDGAKGSDVAGELASPPVEGQIPYCTPPKDAKNRKKQLSHSVS